MNERRLKNYQAVLAKHVIAQDCLDQLEAEEIGRYVAISKGPYTNWLDSSRDDEEGLDSLLRYVADEVDEGWDIQFLYDLDIADEPTPVDFEVKTVVTVKLS